MLPSASEALADMLTLLPIVCWLPLAGEVISMIGSSFLLFVALSAQFCRDKTSIPIKKYAINLGILKLLAMFF
jgi:hypothetical protein